MRKSTALFLVMLLVMVCAGVVPVSGALSDFGKDVEQEQKENRSKSTSSDHSDGHSHHHSHSHNDNADDDFDDNTSCFGSFLGAGSGLGDDRDEARDTKNRDNNNQNVSENDAGCLLTRVFEMEGFTRYPYSNDEVTNFVVVDKSALEPANPNATESEGSTVQQPKRLAEGDVHRTFFILEAGGQYAYSNGTGVFAAISGRFWKFFGPECEYKYLWDGRDYLVYYAYGLNFGLFQFSWGMFDIYFQGAGMRGATHMDGTVLGLIVRLYPVKPLTLQFRYGAHSYKDIDFSDVEGRIGIMLWRIEFFAGYRYLRAKHAQLEGPVFGIRMYL